MRSTEVAAVRIALVTDTYTPYVVAGRGVTRRHQLTRPVSLLDIPATVLWSFGLEVPPCYQGRPLTGAFTGDRVSVPA